jgi:chromosomal replication initiation ATPase DnaA
MEKNVKTTPEVLALINKRVNDNKREVEGATADLESLTKVSNEYGKMLDITMKRMVLKDKIIFHKAIIAALSDLAQEIEK